MQAPSRFLLSHTEFLVGVKTMVKTTLTQRTQGTVRTFDLSKGYGYITVEGRDDIFVHYSNIEGEGLRALRQGERVSFLIEESEIGPQALRVVRSQ